MNGQAGVPTLSFVPADEAAGYLRLFQASGGSSAPGGRISGDAARTVLMQSRLPVSDLGRIWELADMRKMGSLSQAEFVLAMFLAQSRIRGKALPDVLPHKIAAEVAAAAAGPAQQPMQMQMQQPLAMPTPMQQQPMASFQQHQMPAPMQMSMQMPAPIQPAPTSMHMPTPAPAPAASRPNDPGAPESLADFEASFPSLSPAGASAASAAAPSNALSSVRQSFAQGGAARTWAITAAERASYAAVFRQWAGGRRVLGGAQAREVFAQSGLSQAELARVWALADASNQGELNADEFAVAMHVIFRRLAGEPVPDRLPDDLVPHSTRDFVDSLAAMKQQLLSDAAGAPRRSTPLRTATATASATAAASEYSDDDDTATYTSANRRRPGTTTPAPAAAARASSPAATQPVDQLRRTVAQRRSSVERARAAATAHQTAGAESRVTRRWRIDDLKKEIEDIHRTTPAPGSSADPASERARLLAKRQALAAGVHDALRRLPDALAEYSSLSAELAQVRRDVAERRRRSNGGGKTGGSADDMQARAARLVAQRMAALTGETLDAEGASDGGLADEEREIARELQQRTERVDSVASGLRHVERAMRDMPPKHAALAAGLPWGDDERRASEEVRELLGRLRRIEQQPPRPRASAFSPVAGAPGPSAAAAKDAGARDEQSVAKDALAGPSLADRLARASTKQERDQILRDLAEERFRERQRALGLPDAEDAPPEMAEKPAAASNP
ncbi:actin organization and endocytosis protein, partial [Coemansia erecta]